jgi:hypothetical protein
MQVVAQRSDGSAFLILVGQDKSGRAMGVVVEVEDEIVHRPFNLQSIIAHGYWCDTVPGPSSDRALEIAKAHLNKPSK